MQIICSFKNIMTTLWRLWIYAMKRKSKRGYKVYFIENKNIK